MTSFCISKTRCYPVFPPQLLSPLILATRHSPNLVRTTVTRAEMEPLAWAWPTPAKKPSIWALTLARLLAQTPGIRKVPCSSLMATVPGESRREILAPGSKCPDWVTTEPRRVWSGHLHVLELHPGNTGRQRGRGASSHQLGRASCSVTRQRCLDTHTLPNPQRPQRGPA